MFSVLNLLPFFSFQCIQVADAVATEDYEIYKVRLSVRVCVCVCVCVSEKDER